MDAHIRKNEVTAPPSADGLQWHPRPRRIPREQNKVFALILLSVAIGIFAVIVTFVVLLHYAEVRAIALP